MGEPILEGSLRSISVPDLLTFINMIKKTGDLTLANGDVTKHIFWDRGEMVFATSSAPEESLGSYLLRHGKINQEENMKSGLRVEPGKRQGKVLVQMGILSPKELWWGVKNQVLEIIYSLFQWRDGRFGFEDMPEANEEKIKLSVSTTNIIMEGIRRLDEWPRIRELIPSDKLVPIVAPEEGRDGSVKFYEDELDILAHIDGQRTVRDIIHQSRLNEFETLRVLMSFILARYVILPIEIPPPAAEEADDAERLEGLIAGYNRMYAMISAALSKCVSEETRQQLFAEALDSARDTVLEGLGVGDAGGLGAKSLLANIADLGHERRHQALDAALNNYLSFILFEASKHLDGKEKASIYQKVEEWSGSHEPKG